MHSQEVISETLIPLPFTQRQTSIVVQKFGGTSVASVDHIKRIAARALAAQRNGNQVVVVVSAMSGETNRLLELARTTHAIPDLHEQDVLAATGEQTVAALTAIAIQAAGGKSRSLLGHQVRILTDSTAGDARIRYVEVERLTDALERGEIPVVAGFQGVDENGNITTLGRGGSDTTAVAIAAALRASVCEIYTDVDGVYTADPNLCNEAQKIPRISYQAMFTMAALGAKVLHGRSVAIAMKYNIPLAVRTSFNDSAGTQIVKADDSLEGASVSGLACDLNFTSLNLAGGSSLIEAIALLGEHQISAEGMAAGLSSLMIRNIDLARALPLLLAQGWQKISETKVAKISIIGMGLKSDPTFLSRAARWLSAEGLEIHSITASESSITATLMSSSATQAMQILHKGFGLEIAPSSNLPGAIAKCG